MSDLLLRLAQRAMGERAVVQPLLGPSLGAPPALVSEWDTPLASRVDAPAKANARVDDAGLAEQAELAEPRGRRLPEREAERKNAQPTLAKVLSQLYPEENERTPAQRGEEQGMAARGGDQARSPAMFEEATGPQPVMRRVEMEVAPMTLPSRFGETMPSNDDAEVSHEEVSGRATGRIFAEPGRIFAEDVTALKAGREDVQARGDVGLREAKPQGMRPGTEALMRPHLFTKQAEERQRGDERSAGTEVQVTIGRIDLHAAAAPVPRAVSAAPQRTILSLEAYLAQRRGERR